MQLLFGEFKGMELKESYYQMVACSHILTANSSLLERCDNLLLELTGHVDPQVQKARALRQKENVATEAQEGSHYQGVSRGPISTILTEKCAAVFLPSPEDLNRMLKEMDDVDMLTLVIQEMSKEFPTLMETLVNERDHFLSGGFPGGCGESGVCEEPARCFWLWKLESKSFDLRMVGTKEDILKITENGRGRRFFVLLPEQVALWLLRAWSRFRNSKSASWCNQ
ncbi:hypothetical protein Cgig2_008907 [Carnegiea gigantea]|uniref:Uncharacterized protein n=1 Tax=Carnegiea gigantea TaxID=171969 RepID=A0A9Q1GI09_9CARY|nr:hypothetical protein Cgig2_008907 [Carnegiea gigantea]